jgi:RsmE family RNA methyltransferase
LDEDALLGLEQGGWVHLPTFAVHRSFSRFIRSFEPPHGEMRVVFDPSGQRDLLQVLGSDGATSSPVTLAFGPDGGFLAEEVELLRAAEFRPATLSRSILRTEVAVAAGLGQLDLVRAVVADLSHARGS